MILCRSNREISSWIRRDYYFGSLISTGYVNAEAHQDAGALFGRFLITAIAYSTPNPIQKLMVVMGDRMSVALWLPINNYTAPYISGYSSALNTETDPDLVLTINLLSLRCSESFLSSPLI